MREYRPGDAFNRIHWPTTARTNRLMVREFELDPTVDVWIVLDLHSDVLATRRWGAMAAAVLNEVSRWRHEDASCWFASLGEISDWVRNQRLK